MTFLTDKQEPRLWVISDPHLISEKLHDNGTEFQRMQATSAGKDLSHQEVALASLVNYITSLTPSKRPDALIICGDLTFNGAKESLTTFAKIMQPLNEAGVTLLPVPGNHDIYDGWARRSQAEVGYRVPQISPADWRQIFASTYQAAESVDQSSLAYTYQINHDWKIVLADSNKYGQTESFSHPITSGYLGKEQLAYLESEFKLTQAAQQKCILVMHHNLYSHNDVVHDGFVLDNHQELEELLGKYQVPVVLSGHIHAQNIAQALVTEIVTGCFASFNQPLGKIKLSQTSFDYQKVDFEMEKYLPTAKKTDPLYQNYHAYQVKLFYEQNFMQMRRILQKTNLTQAEIEQVADLMAKMHWDFFTGNNLLSDDEYQQLIASADYQKLIKVKPELSNYAASLYQTTGSNLAVKLSF